MKNYFKRSAIKPSGEEFLRCSELIARIEDLAPSDSYISVHVQREPDGSYHATIPVHSTGQHFFSEGTTGSLFGAIKEAQHEMLKHLREWKRTRF